jgi:hypothetical protein
VEQFDAVGDAGLREVLLYVRGSSAPVSADAAAAPLVRDHPDAAGIDRGMWSALVERGVRGIGAAGVTCAAAGCHEAGGACTVTLAFGRLD